MKDNEIEALVARLEGLANAYPEDVFPPISPEEAIEVRNTHPGLLDRASAMMGRHLGKFFKEAAAALASRDKEIERLVKERDEALEAHAEENRMHKNAFANWQRERNERIDAEMSVEKLAALALAECTLAATATRERDEARAEVERLRKVVFIVAPSYQGGHSRTGGIIAEAIGVPFPVRMESLVPSAVAAGFDPIELWPWSELARYRLEDEVIRARIAALEEEAGQ